MTSFQAGPGPSSQVLAPTLLSKKWAWWALNKTLQLGEASRTHTRDCLAGPQALRAGRAGWSRVLEAPLGQEGTPGKGAAGLWEGAGQEARVVEAGCGGLGWLPGTVLPQTPHTVVDVSCPLGTYQHHPS